MKKPSSLKIFLGLGLTAILIASSIAYVHYRAHNPNTDDAYVKANVVEIAAQVSGPIIKVYANNHQPVQTAQILFDIDPASFKIAVAKARATLTLAQQEVSSSSDRINAAMAKVKQSKAKYINAKQQSQRILTLVNKGLLSKSAGDNARADLDTSKADLHAAKSELQRIEKDIGKTDENNARIRQARANLAQALLNLEHTHVQAPATGILNNFNLRPGTMVSAGKPLFVLVENDDWWLEANYKETQLQHIKSGQKATIHVDMYPKITFEGHVMNISPGSGSQFSLLPPENATGNWVKVTQRFPVKIHIDNVDNEHPLRMGASAQVTVHTP